MSTEKYYFLPKPDITAWELAQIFRLRMGNAETIFPDGIPPEVRRHLMSEEEMERDKRDKK